MRSWAMVIYAGTQLGFEFWGLHSMTIYRDGVLVAENATLTEARQIILRAMAEETV
jgi:hypothetical protein